MQAFGDTRRPFLTSEYRQDLISVLNKHSRGIADYGEDSIIDDAVEAVVGVISNAVLRDLSQGREWY
jgi:hypothetical protein